MKVWASINWLICDFAQITTTITQTAHEKMLSPRPTVIVKVREATKKTPFFTTWVKLGGGAKQIFLVCEPKKLRILKKMPKFSVNILSVCSYIKWMEIWTSKAAFAAEKSATEPKKAANTL